MSAKYSPAIGILVAISPASSGGSVLDGSFVMKERSASFRIWREAFFSMERSESSKP